LRRPLFAWYLREMPEAAASASRVLLVDAGQTHDVFEVVEVSGGILRVRTAFLFELGEEMKISLVEDGVTYEATARVLAHVDGGGKGDDKVTELELEGKTAVP
jgi:hypothetical protein